MQKKILRADADDKVRGNAKYAADLYTSDMLVCKILTSPYANAIVKTVHIEKAKKISGVEAVFTPFDVPQRPYTPCGHPYTFVSKEFENMKLLTDHPRFVGDAVVAVVADTEEIAREAMKRIDVEYEELPAVYSIEEAMKQDAPLLHEERPGNVLSDSCEFREGASIEEAEELSDAVIETVYQTSPVAHCHLEPCNSYAYMDGNGRITVVTSSQSPFLARLRIAQALGISQGRVCVINACIGGGFGNKQDVNQEPLNAFLTMRLGGRPVRLAYTREECMVMTRTRYAFTMKCRASASKDGTLRGFDMKYYANGGAYATRNHSVAVTAAYFNRLHYGWQAFHTLPTTVFTNHPSGGAMRGYGAPQGVFGMESAIDDLAYELKIDPLELRFKNLRPVGYVETESDVRITSDGMKQCLEIGAERMEWKKKREEFRTQNGSIRHGIGCAIVGFCAGTVPFNVEVSGARITLCEDGTFILQVGATEIGQGSNTVFAQIAAEVIGVPFEDIYVVPAQNTDVSPYDVGAFATRQTYICGTAIVEAALEIKKKILSFACTMYGIEEELKLEDAQVIKKDNTVVASLHDLALRTVYDKNTGQVLSSDASIKMKAAAPVFGATFAEITVDLESCIVKIDKIMNIQDSGRIINHDLAVGQVQGGIGMGIGYGLYEQLLYNENGKTLNDNLLDYKLPTFMDMPEMEVEFADTREPTGPLGAKGIGEPPACSPAAAIRNAILNATGVHMNTLPITPQRLYEAFKKERLIGGGEDV